MFAALADGAGLDAAEGWQTISSRKRQAPPSPSPASSPVAGPSSAKSNRSTSKEEKKRAKKRAKAEAKLDANVPAFLFNLGGFHAGRTIMLRDIRDLLLYILADDKALSWMVVNHKRSFAHVVALYVPGITPEALGLAPLTPVSNMPVSMKFEAGTSSLPVLSTMFSHACPTKAPSDRYRLHSVMHAVTSAPIPPDEKAQREREREQRRRREGPGNRPAASYVLSPDALLNGDYPVPSYEMALRPGLDIVAPPELDVARWRRDDGFIETPAGCGRAGEPHIIGVDCEMVYTAAGQELARISLVDSTGVIYDRLVMPSAPIIDYATQYSGISPDTLEGVTTTLEDVHADLTRLIDYNTILVGHSIDCDLRVIKLAHPWVCDTAVLYHHTRGPPLKPALKWLAQRYLQREIQVPKRHVDGVPVGHDSVEDSTTALELFALKVKNGPTFGEFANDTETIFERMKRMKRPPRTCVVDHGNPNKFHGEHADTSIACSTDEQVLSNVLEQIQTHDFVYARFGELAHALGWDSTLARALARAEATKVAADATASSDTMPPDAYATMNDRIKRLHDGLPRRTALVIFTGTADPRAVMALSARKGAFEKLHRSSPFATRDLMPDARWTEADDRQLQEEIEKARMGLSMYLVKA